MTIIKFNFRRTLSVSANNNSSQPLFTLFSFGDDVVSRYYHHGQIRTSEIYASLLNSLRRHLKGVDLLLRDVDGPFVETYERYLYCQGLCTNTVSFYLKRLRALYRRAVDEGLVADASPFRRVSTPSEKTVKRAVSLRTLKRLAQMDLSERPSCQFARDIFLFSFYTRGMSFVDIAYLEKRDLRNGILTYRRKKTNQTLSIRWEPCMQAILNRYAAPDTSPYLFNIISDLDRPHRIQYQAMQSKVNRHLRHLGITMALPRPLTMYCARHSWASIAYSEGIPTSIISEGMGHDSERTTQIYLASLRGEVIDKANRKLLRLLSTSK